MEKRGKYILCDGESEICKVLRQNLEEEVPPEVKTGRSQTTKIESFAVIVRGF